MLAEEKITRVSRQSSCLKGNDPLLLDGSQTAWRVQSGSLALFAIHVQNGSPKGRRRYLFSIKAGETMFTASTEDDHPYQILAVALEETELLPMSRSAFDRWIVKEPETAIEQLENWIHRLGSAVSGIASATLPTPLAVPGCGILDQGEIFQPAQGAIVWVQILQGHPNLLGRDGLDLTSAMGWVPLETYLWLQAIDIVELELCITGITNANILLNGLNYLQTIVLKRI